MEPDTIAVARPSTAERAQRPDLERAPGSAAMDPTRGAEQRRDLIDTAVDVRERRGAQGRQLLTGARAPTELGAATVVPPAAARATPTPTTPDPPQPRAAWQRQPQGVRGHTREAWRGLSDGVADSVGGLAHTAKLAWQLATDSQLRAQVAEVASTLRQAIQTPEGQRLVGAALDAAGSGVRRELVATLRNNPAYAAGYLAGSLLTGGAFAKGLASIGRLATSLRPVAHALEVARAGLAPHAKKALIGAGAAGALAFDGSPPAQRLVEDVLQTAANAPAGVATIAPAVATREGRRVVRAATEHARELARRQLEQARPQAVPAMP